MREFDRLLKEETDRLNNIEDLSLEHLDVALQIGEKYLENFKTAYNLEINYFEKSKIRRQFIDLCLNEIQKKVNLSANDNHKLYDLCCFIYTALLV